MATEKINFHKVSSVPEPTSSDGFYCVYSEGNTKLAGLYIVSTGKVYRLSNVFEGVIPSIVQEKGNSTTSVMSQDAVTKLLEDIIISGGGVVVDNHLNSESTTNALSAYQGKVLNEKKLEKLSATLNNLIDFNKIIVGKKVTSIKITGQTHEPILEDDPNYAYVKLDLPSGIVTGDYTIQGIRAGEDGSFDESLGDVYSPLLHQGIGVLGIDGAPHFQIALVEYGGGEYADLKKVIKQKWLYSHIRAFYLNIPIDTPERLANIKPETSELTFYLGSAPKDYDSSLSYYSSKIVEERTPELFNGYYTYISAKQFQTDYIPVKEGSILVRGLFHSGLGTIYAFNSNMAQIATIPGGTRIGSQLILNELNQIGGYYTIPKDTAYIRISVSGGGIYEGSIDFLRTNRLSVTQVKEDEEGNPIYKDLNGFHLEHYNYLQPVNGISRKEIESNEYHLKSGRKLSKPLNLGFIGDSITWIDWWKPLSKYFVLNSTLRRAFAGAKWESNSIESEVTAFINAYKNGEVKGYTGEIIDYPDYVFIWLGTNVSTNLGDNSEVMAKSIEELDRSLSMAEAMRFYINWLRKEFEHSHLIIMTPYHNNITAHKTNRSVCQQIEDMSHRMSTPCLNLFNDIQIDPTFEPTEFIEGVQQTTGRYFYDPVHLNNAGKELVCKHVANYIRSREL